MNKAKVREIRIAEKIYIFKEDVEDHDHLISLYTYDNGDEFLSTIEETELHYLVPSNSYYKLEWDSLVDERNFEKLDFQLEFSGELRPEQAEAVSKFFIHDRARSGLLQAKPGWGKCKPVTSQILSSEGLLSLEELRTTKAKVYSLNGPTNIVDYYDNGLKECFEIKTSLGNIITGTENHPILLWDKDTQVEQFKTIKEITKNDYIIGMYNTNIFGNGTIEDPYLVGLLIGDGSLTVQNRIGFASADIELQTYFLNKFPGSRVVNKINHNEYYFSDKDLYLKYVLAFDINCKSIHKPVHKTLRQLNRSQTILLLQGLFDTDGCANNDGTIEYCSSSKELAYYVFIQLLNLGIYCRIRQKSTKVNDTYVIDINSKYFCDIFYNVIGFRVQRKQIRQKLLKSGGALVSGTFLNLHKLFRNEYNKLYKNSGLSTYFRQNSQISIKRVKDIIKAIEDKQLPTSPIISSFDNKYAAKVMSIKSIGVLPTADIQVDDTSHSYVSEGVVNHNTFASCSLIAKNSTKTLILVHTKLLFNQWIEELEQQIPNAIIGKIGDGLFSIGDVTVAIYKTAYNNISQLQNIFSTLLVDEAHKCPADMFSFVVNNINAKIKIAITATPRRKDGKHVYLADYFSTFKVVAQDSRKLATPSFTIKQTDFKFAVIDPKRDWARAMNKLCEDKAYQKLIAETAIAYIKQNRCPLIIGERVQMLKDLQTLIPTSICVIGESDKEIREDALQNLGKKYKAILTTKLFDEGISCHRLDTLMLPCPSNNPIQLEQRIGRIERLHPEKQFPLIVDFWLSGGIVSRQQKNRLLWYQQNGYNLL